MKPKDFIQMKLNDFIQISGKREVYKVKRILKTKIVCDDLTNDIQDVSIKNSEDIKPIKRNKKLGIDYAMKVYKNIYGKYDYKQNPDQVSFTKQWDEFGRLKGWMVCLGWFCDNTRKESVNIFLDITPYYVNVVGNFDLIPDYIPFKHQYPKKEPKEMDKYENCMSWDIASKK